MGMGINLSLTEQMQVMAVAMLTSKGAAAVTGGGFITLAATLGSVRPELLPGVALLLGIDKFMAECRSLTNIVGNGVAAVVVSIVEGELDRDMMNQALSGADKGQDLQSESIDGSEIATESNSTSELGTT